MLTGANTYSGATTDNLGTLVLSGGSSTGTGGVTVGAATVSAGVSGNATLQIKGNYTIGGAVNVKNGDGVSSEIGRASCRERV